MTPESRQAGARYAVSATPLPGLAPVFQDAGNYIYEDKAALPQVRDVNNAPFLLIPSPPTRLIAEDGPPQTAQVLIASQWYPGWTAKYNGEKAELSAGPEVFCTVVSAARGHQIDKSYLELRYEPAAFRVGVYLLCLALGAAAGVFAAAGGARLSRNRRG